MHRACLRIECKDICLLFSSESKSICPQRAFCLRSRGKCTFTEITRFLPSDSDLKPFYSEWLWSGFVPDYYLMTDKKSYLLSNCYYDTQWKGYNTHYIFIHLFLFGLSFMDGPLKKLRPGSKVGDEWLWSGFTTHSETLSTESDLPSLFAHNEVQDFYEFAIQFSFFLWSIFLY